MSLTGKPLWLEGMFLRPQHMQQYDRWIESNLEQRISGILSYAWGIRSLRIDPDALRNGQLQVVAADLVFPDGTIYAAPDAQPLPAARRLTAEHQGKRVYLAVPLRTTGGIEVAGTNGSGQRFRRAATEVRDTATSDRPSADILVGMLNVRLVIEGEPLDELIHFAVAEVEAVDSQGLITLSESFIPPILASRASARLVTIMEQVRGLLRARANVLASGATGQGEISRSDMVDLMTLGLVNRYETSFNHMIAAGVHAPELVYRECIALIGEISAYAATGRRPPELPSYNHSDLRATFDPLLPVLRGLLSIIIERNAISIPLSERDFGVWLGEIEDRLTFTGRRFILIAQANVALETIRRQMPIQMKVGPVEQIRDLVNLQLPGIGIAPLSVAPREIPFIQNAVYFELDGGNPLWAQFPDSAAFALHVSGAYPGLRMELWAIQRGQ